MRESSSIPGNRSLHCVLISGLLAAMMLFVALPKTPPGSYLSAGNGTWHISKASKATEVEIEGAGEIAAADQRFQLLELDFESSSISTQAAPFLKLSQILCCAHRFRPPPVV